MVPNRTNAIDIWGGSQISVSWMSRSPFHPQYDSRYDYTSEWQDALLNSIIFAAVQNWLIFHHVHCVWKRGHIFTINCSIENKICFFFSSTYESHNAYENWKSTWCRLPKKIKSSQQNLYKWQEFTNLYTHVTHPPQVYSDWCNIMLYRT